MSTAVFPVPSPVSSPAADQRPVVREATLADREDWDRFVVSRPEACGYHEWPWQDVFARAFGHRATYLMARVDGAVQGVLPLIEMRSLVFGRFLTSLPFVNQGGVLATSEGVARALLAAARSVGQSRGCRHVELRHVDRRFPDLPVRQHKVGMRLAIGPGAWERLDRKVRNQIRKAEKSDMAAEIGHEALLPEFYAVFARNMRDLGTPVYGRALFTEVLRAFPDRTQVIVVRRGAQPVAAGVTFRTRGTVEVPWASSLREFNTYCPNHLVYWRAIESAIEAGCDTLDFGRSTPHEGTFHFKSQWGAEPVPLHWEYPFLTGQVPDQGPTNPKFRAAIEIWKRCPLWLANAVGPHIVRSIP